MMHKSFKNSKRQAAPAAAVRDRCACSANIRQLGNIGVARMKNHKATPPGSTGVKIFAGKVLWIKMRRYQRNQRSGALHEGVSGAGFC
jgi:hypothetical protein